tara:strand:+ start:973 stop:1473 length:501 start_codon:yes stop_codon:yes gene_type:complete
MKNTYWDAIEPGDVVSFIYKGQQDISKSARRVVICLDPRYEHRKKTTNRIVEYFVGLEIFNSQKSNLTPTVIKQTFDILSENADVVLTDPQSGGKSRMQKIYADLKELLKREPDLFRTYFYRECRKRRVFLEDKYARLNSLQIKQVTEQLLQEGQDTLLIGDDIDL